jgi:acetylornithine deacetylase/succinyl-diaminopimelate desuccinylase-like protein
VRVVSAGGAPAVIASWPAPAGAPTGLLYAHLDVVPAGPERGWTSPPFEPTERDGRLFGRGTADDKAGVVLHLAVLRLFAGRPPVGVVLFVEGEEEVGSPTLPALLAEHRGLLRCDVIVVADSINAGVDVPALTTSLRGFVDVAVEVRLLERSLHSGLYGGPIGDALTALCRLLATLHDARGAVAIDGLFTGRGEGPPLDEASFAADAGLVPEAPLLGSGTLAERLWHRPAVAVTGIDAPSVADASPILLDRACALVSLRLAPGDHARRGLEALTRHLTSHAPWGAQVLVTEGAHGEPVRLETGGAAYDLARSALAEAYGTATVETGVGGSIPFIAEFARTYPSAEVLVTGVGDPASRWHGADESLHLGMWGRACLAEAMFLMRLPSEPGVEVLNFSGR